jgi:hypothetical protein
MTQSEYSEFLTTKDFWNLLNGDKIFIYQEDSLILNDFNKKFLEYDFIGAPFLKNTDDTPNCVGNGGLSIRTKSVALEIIKLYPINECTFNRSTIDYMDLVDLIFPPEDVYYSKVMQEQGIGLVADWDTAYEFSSEGVFNVESFGCHKIWVSCSNWKNHIIKLFKYSIYQPKSDLDKYLKFCKKNNMYNLTKNISNAFDIDLYFFCKINNIEFISTSNACQYFKNIGLNGFIYHPKQILNIYSKVCFYRFMDNIYTYYKNELMSIQIFANKYLYNISFDYFSELTIKKLYSCLNDNYNVIMLVFIGNEERGIQLINKLINYKKIYSEFNISFCFNNKKIIESDIIRKTIKYNFDYYAIYLSNEFGTDITPTLLMYNDIIKDHKFIHIYKFHTKSITKDFNELTDFLLSIPLSELIEYENPRCNCISNDNYYISLEDDLYNYKLIQQNSKFINRHNYFVGGTIFYTNNRVMNTVLNYTITNNYRSFYFNNLYENNQINSNYSPIHFIERLFGVIKINHD